jgi:hypothetical protein
MRRTGALMARKFDKNDRLVEQWRRLVLDKSRNHHDGSRRDEPVKENAATATKPEAILQTTSLEGKRAREEDENQRSDDKEASKRQRVEEAIDDGKVEGEE